MKCLISPFVSVILVFVLQAQQLVEKNFYSTPTATNKLSELIFKSTFAEITFQSAINNNNPYTIKGVIDNQKFETEFRQIESNTKKTTILKIKNASYAKSKDPIKLLSNEMIDESKWLLFASNKYVQRLEFNVAKGSLNLNLSELPVKTLKINSINASNSIQYHLGQLNKIDLDTVYIKNEMGNVTVKNFCNSRCKFLNCELGFGKMFFHVGNDCQVSAMCKFKVGTGELVIELPDKRAPIKLIINRSVLSKVQIPENFIKIDKKTFQTPFFPENEKDNNPLIVEIDVSLGKVVIK